MKVTVERTPASEAVLNVELEWVELEKASDRAYRKLAQKYTVPGFRRGHAPRTMIERMLGKETIYQEGLEELIDESYRTAVREHELRPLAQPSVDAPPIEMGQPYTFVARVPVLSPVEIGDYQAVRVERPTVEVTDEDVQQVLERIQQDQAMWLPAERPAQLGDHAVVDLVLTVGEREVSNLHDNEFELVEERPGIFAGMDQQLIGLSEGESKQFTTTIPEEYSNPDLAGKEAQYDVTVKGVKFRELPALDDELAKSVGEFSTLDEVRGAIRQQLLSQKESDAQRTLRDQVIKAVTDLATVEIHPVLVADEVDAMMRETERMLEQSRLNLQQYLAMSQKSEEEYRAGLEPEAEGRVKRDLVLSAVADREGLSVTDTELEGWLGALTALGGKPMRLRQLSATQRSNIENRLRREKATTRLLEIATEGHPEPIVIGAQATDDEAEDAEATDETEANALAAASAPAGEAPSAEASVPAPAKAATPTASGASATMTEATEAAPMAETTQEEVP